MKKILFVCTGNTCRSAMAEGIFNNVVEKDLQLRDAFYAKSAGIAAYKGQGANPNAINALRQEWNIDISTHITKPISDELIADSDLILTMCQNHKSFILHLYPEIKNKIYTLKEFTANNIMNRNNLSYDYNINISDPYGKSLEEYKRCAAEIRDSIEKLILILKTSNFL
jgi:protein-tyrosine phosphatase